MDELAIPGAEPDLDDVEAKMRIAVRNIGIPPRPTILDQIEHEMRRSDPDYNRLAGIIVADVALSASLIKVVNSPYYGFSKKARSVQEALLVLGLKVAIRTIAGLVLHTVFKRVANLERFWDASACTARVAGWLAQQVPRNLGIRAEDAYTFGLFRDCGIPVLMIPFPEYREILQIANQEISLPFTKIEDDSLSINHAIVGSQLAEDWLLPDVIHQAIRFHHDQSVLLRSSTQSASTAVQRLIAIAQLAEFLIQLHTDLNHTMEWIKLGPLCLATLALDSENLHRLSTESKAIVQEHE